MHVLTSFSKVALALASLTLFSSSSALPFESHDKRAVARIAGGNVAPADDFGYIAYIRVTNSTYDGLTCTGSLIAPNVVLTAAHCLFVNDEIAYMPENFGVKFTHKTPTTAEMQSAYKATRIIPYPNFRLSTMNNDIGLIILEKDVPSSVAMPVKLYAGDSDYDTPVTAAGFGITDPENDISVPKELMEVDLHLGKDDYCKKKYALYQNKYLVCTDGTAGIDTCLGDSGGPLSTPFENEDDSGSAILGVTSFAPSSADNPKGACAQAGGSGYYTRVSTYISWIASSCNLDIKSISVNNSTVTNKADTENKQSQDGNDNNKTSKDGEEEQGNLEDDNESDKDNENSTDNNSDEEPHTSTVFVDPSTTHIVTMTSENSSSSDDSAASSLYSNSVIMRSVACAFVAVLVAAAI